MKIRTWHEFPPIPDRRFDWGAVDDDTYEACRPIGWGSTEAEAVADLWQQLENESVWTSRRYLSCAQWGLFDVTDLPWCCPLERTEVLYGWGERGPYDGTQ